MRARTHTRTRTTHGGKHGSHAHQLHTHSHGCVWISAVGPLTHAPLHGFEPFDLHRKASPQGLSISLLVRGLQTSCDEAQPRIIDVIYSEKYPDQKPKPILTLQIKTKSKLLIYIWKRKMKPNIKPQLHKLKKTGDIVEEKGKPLDLGLQLVMYTPTDVKHRVFDKSIEGGCSKRRPVKQRTV
jgi:hypothetical protein